MARGWAVSPDTDHSYDQLQSRVETTTLLALHAETTGLATVANGTIMLPVARPYYFPLLQSALASMHGR